MTALAYRIHASPMSYPYLKMMMIGEDEVPTDVKVSTSFGDSWTISFYTVFKQQVDSLYSHIQLDQLISLSSHLSQIATDSTRPLCACVGRSLAMLKEGDLIHQVS